MKIKRDFMHRHGGEIFELTPDDFFFSKLELALLKQYKDKDGVINCDDFQFKYSWLNQKIEYMIQAKEAAKAAVGERCESY